MQKNGEANKLAIYYIAGSFERFIAEKLRQETELVLSLFPGIIGKVFSVGTGLKLVTSLSHLLRWWFIDGVTNYRFCVFVSNVFEYREFGFKKLRVRSPFETTLQQFNHRHFSSVLLHYTACALIYIISIQNCFVLDSWCISCIPHVHGTIENLHQANGVDEQHY